MRNRWLGWVIFAIVTVLLIFSPTLPGLRALPLWVGLAGYIVLSLWLLQPEMLYYALGTLFEVVLRLPEAALGWYRRVLDVSRRGGMDYAALMQIGYLHLTRGRFQEAREYLEKALVHPRSRDHGHPSLIINLALAHWKQGNLGRGVHLLRTFPRDSLGKFRSKFLSNQAYLLMLQDKLAEAEEAVDEALYLEPNLKSALATKGQLLYRQGRPDEAEGYLAKAAREQPNEETFYYLALVYMKQNRPDEARKALDRALELANDQPNPLSPITVKDLRAALETLGGGGPKAG